MTEPETGTVVESWWQDISRNGIFAFLYPAESYPITQYPYKPPPPYVPPCIKRHPPRMLNETAIDFMVRLFTTYDRVLDVFICDSSDQRLNDHQSPVCIEDNPLARDETLILCVEKVMGKANGFVRISITKQRDFLAVRCHALV
jgi:hypothetical protein